MSYIYSEERRSIVYVQKSPSNFELRQHHMEMGNFSYQTSEVVTC